MHDARFFTSANPKSNIQNLKSDVLWLPKSGEAYEDAWALPAGEGPAWRFAVADGATESAFARDWARCLAEGFVADGAGDFGAGLAAWRAAWRAAVAGRVAGLPWYAAAKAAQGAHAAFVGLTLDASGAWEALAVGDCCLFHLRAGTLLAAWPLDDPAAFTHRPALVPSLPEAPAPRPEHAAGTFAPGDAFILATDALAAWLLETGPAQALAFTPDAFAAAVAHARQARTLRNDDVTVLRVLILDF